MAKKDFEAVIGKIITEKEFRKSMQKDLEKTVKKYNLSKNEVQALSSIKDDAKAKDAVKLLDKRISKWPVAGGGRKR